LREVLHGGTLVIGYWQTRERLLALDIRFIDVSSGGSMAVYGRHLLGIFIAGVGVAATLRVIYHNGGGALLFVGVLFLIVGGYLIFRRFP
jgi:hypothetical protein